MSHANLAFRLQIGGDGEAARPHFEQALEQVRPDDAANLLPALVANLFLLGGTDAHWEYWKQQFDRVLPEDQPGVTAQLALRPADLTAHVAPDRFGTWPSAAAQDSERPSAD
jgi:hypothetical protein